MASNNWLGRFVAAPALLIGASCVLAQPAGGPESATDNDGTCFWTATIGPLSTVGTSSCVALMDGLDAQNFNGGGGWTVDFAGVLSEGAVSLDQYYAWVSNEPTVTCGGTTFPGEASGQIGGAAFCLEYTPGPGDPATSDVHWVQAIRTNSPSQFGIDNGVAGDDGFFNYLDNGLNGAPGMDPFYDTNGAAGPDYFLDIPFRSCDEDCDVSVEWEACVYLATGSVATQDLTLYSLGWSWGFTFTCTPVPAPGATSLLLVIGAVAYRRRR
ncbi:MAG: hypothetical protein H7Y88_05310 [Phycisphaerales bacterium]|nr:hypothetical protein [Phycisphaerales bacterium]